MTDFMGEGINMETFGTQGAVSFRDEISAELHSHKKGLRRNLFRLRGIQHLCFYWDKDTIGSGMGFMDMTGRTCLLSKGIEVRLYKVDLVRRRMLGLDENQIFRN